MASQEIAALQAKLESGDMPADEPLFVLRGRDCLAPQTLAHWVSAARQLGASEEKIRGAVAIMERMRSWPTVRLPGRPETAEQRRPSPFKPGDCVKAQIVGVQGNGRHNILVLKIEGQDGPFAILSGSQHLWHRVGCAGSVEFVQAAGGLSANFVPDAAELQAAAAYSPTASPAMVDRRERIEGYMKATIQAVTNGETVDISEAALMIQGMHAAMLAFIIIRAQLGPQAARDIDEAATAGIAAIADRLGFDADLILKGPEGK